MAQTEKAPARAVSTEHKPSIWKRIFGKDDSNVTPAPPPQEEQPRPGLGRRLSRKVVPGLPRPGTFKRQQSELRDRLEPATRNPDERRTLSVDRRRNASGRDSSTVLANHNRLSAPQLLDGNQTIDSVLDGSKQLSRAATHDDEVRDYVDVLKEPSSVDTTYTQSVSTEAFDEMILEELEKRWILNLSMHFRDKSRREKFFVTYAETPTHWRRVTISLDYRNAPKGSLEEELQRTRFQRDKSARIYEAIRESLPDIQFYDTVTNLKLQTENERLHVHVVEDLSEIIHYPPVKAINHLMCRRVREEELVFDSHLSGFVYKVRVDGQVFIKKEIPGPDTVDEFLYEINALHQLHGSHSVIQFGGVVLDNKGETVKGLLISFAEQGALIDVIYDGEGRISWSRRERWAKQIVQGLSEIHEAGFVQGDFTLSNIVIDAHDNAKIIDINRRGCPVGWEPPEVAALIESSQRISMYIGVKSDLYQLGMVLYALATQEDEPENHRPFNLACFPPEIPEYFLDVCYHCLDDNPRKRSQASALLARFPDVEEFFYIDETPVPIVIEARSPGELPNGMHLDRSRTFGQTDDFYDYPATETSDGDGYPRRGRSPRRSRSPPRQVQSYFNPANFPLPPSSNGSAYLDVSLITPIPVAATFADEAAFANDADATLVNENTLANCDASPVEKSVADDLPAKLDETVLPIAIAIPDDKGEKLVPDESATCTSDVKAENVPIPESILLPEEDILPSPSSVLEKEVDIPTPTTIIQLETDILILAKDVPESVTTTEPKQNTPITTQILAVEEPPTSTVIVESETSNPIPAHILPEENLQSLFILERDEDIPSPATVIKSEKDTLVSAHVLLEEDLPTPTTIVRPNDDLPTPISLCGPDEHIPSPPSIITLEENTVSPVVLRPEATIPTPTSIHSPKDDFCNIAHDAEPSSITEATSIAEVSQPRKTEAAAPPTPPQTVLADELAGIGGAHNAVPLEIPLANLDDDLTTDMHNDSSSSKEIRA